MTWCCWPTCSTALLGLGATWRSAGCARPWPRSAQIGIAAPALLAGVNWAVRVPFLVSVFGVALIATVTASCSFSAPWVYPTAAPAVAMVAELVLWPAERRLQVEVDQPSAAGDLRSACLRLAAGGRRPGAWRWWRRRG